MPFLSNASLVFRPLWFVMYNRWDVDEHLQGYGRAVDVLFTAVGTYEVGADLRTEPPCVRFGALDK